MKYMKLIVFVLVLIALGVGAYFGVDVSALIDQASDSADKVNDIVDDIVPE